MSTNSQDQEIDLGQVFNKIKEYLQRRVDSIFDLFLFIKKNIIILSTIIIVGGITGYFLDKNTKTYTHEIIVTPNFGSSDYLYSKIALLQAKKKENDTVFFNTLKIKSIEDFKIEPIIDVYQFIQLNEKNFELIKLMAEDGDLEKIIKDDVTSKNYPFHSIKFSSNDQINTKETINPILTFLNDSEYFNNIKKQSVSNIEIKIKSNEQTIAQIDNLLNEFSNTTSSNQKSDKLVYYNENSQLNEIIKTKDALISEQALHRVNLINKDKIIKEISITTNILNTKGLNEKLRFIFPLLLLLLFFIYSSLKGFYNHQFQKRNLA